MQSTIQVRAGGPVAPSAGGPRLPGAPSAGGPRLPSTGRAVALRDEFGPVRGRPFGLDTAPMRPAVVEGPLGHRLSRRGAVAWEAAW